jgi:hypothetical protein
MDLLTLIAVILIIAWLVGVPILHVTAPLIHLLIVVALVVLVVRLLRGNRVI